MVKATRMHAYDSQQIPDKSVWPALATVTTFDRGKAASRKWKKENALVSKRTTTFTTSSLFVESLIDQLCKLFEKDPVSQKRLYELICQKLYEMKLIDKTYRVEEFQFMRSYYQRALFHLLTVSNSPAFDSKLETFLNQSPSSLTLPASTSSNIFDCSRYQNEFEEIDFIARGGFGRVFRVRNKIDGCEYAIKKICLRYRSKEQFIQSLREVRTLANLDHCNIVAYKAAWFEPFTGMITKGEDSESSSSKTSPELEPSEPEPSVSEQESKDEVEEDSGNIVFASKNEDISKEQSSIPFKWKLLEVSNCDLHEEDHYAHNKEGASSAFGSSYKKELNLPLKNRSLCDHSSKSTNRGCRGQKLLRSQRGSECAVLHIQMQLCKESLREWLDLRNEALQLLHKESFSDQDDSNESIDKSDQSCPLKLDSESVFIALHIFLKILKGVEYVHSMGIVHHDLKPSNIFIEGYEYSSSATKMKREQAYNEKGAESVFDGQKSFSRSQQVRVGDFGLACHLSHRSTLVESENKELEEETMTVMPSHLIETFNCLVQMGHHPSKEDKEVIGTKLYAAPEQLKGHCNSKSDMYSLGIILFELLHPLFTGMERNKIISALRNGTIPDYFKLHYSQMAQVIKALLSNEPGDRPSIKDLIERFKPILKDCRNFSKDELEISVCVSKESSIKEVTHVRNAQSKDFHQVSSYEFKKFQTKESHTLSSSTSEETFQEEAQFSINNCGSYTCHVMQEEQKRTIAKLKEEILKKDEKIKKLHQILQLQNSEKSVEYLKDVFS